MNRAIVARCGFIVANQIRPIICDLSSKDANPLSASIFKAERIMGISYEFDEGSDISGDQIVLKNALGRTELIKRKLDGKTGYATFGNGFPCGKAKIYLFSSEKQLRRAKVIVWISGERIQIESL